MPVYTHAFPDPFPHADRPTPDEIAGLSTQQAIITGTNSGLESKMLSQVQVAQDAVGNLMDGFMEQLARALEDELNNALWTNQDMNEKAVAFTVSGLLPAMETAIGYGFEPLGAPGQGKGGRQRRRRRPVADVGAVPPSVASLPGEPGGGPETLGCTAPTPPGFPAPGNKRPDGLTVVCYRTSFSDACPEGSSPDFSQRLDGTVDTSVPSCTLAPSVLPLPPQPPLPIGGLPLPEPLPPAKPPRKEEEECCPQTLNIRCKDITIKADKVEVPQVDVEIDELDITAPVQIEEIEEPAEQAPGVKVKGAGEERCPDLQGEPVPCYELWANPDYADWIAEARKDGLDQRQILNRAIECGLCQPLREFNPEDEGKGGKTTPPSSVCPEKPLEAFAAIACLPLPDGALEFYNDPLGYLCRAGVTNPVGCWMPLWNAAMRLRDASFPGAKYIADIIGILSCSVGAPLIILEKIGTAIGLGTGITKLGAGGLLIADILARFWNKWLGELPPPIQQPIDYLMAATVPTQLPSGAEADAGYIAGRLSFEEWACLSRANGRVPIWAEKLVDAQQSQLTDDELISLWRRRAIDDATLQAELRANGWINALRVDEKIKSTEWFGSPSDVIEWMLKDVEDPQIQETFQLGGEFHQKYQGHVKDTFDANGISEQDANYIWRAHWRNMAPTTLYELHKRLRKGWTLTLSDEDVLKYVDAVAPERRATITLEILAQRPTSNGFPVPTYREEIQDVSTARAWLESLVTTAYHVSEGLGQSDYPPFWRQRLLAVSYRLPGRIDLRRGYSAGVYNLGTLEEAFQDLGYDPARAAKMAKTEAEYQIRAALHKPVSTEWLNNPYDVGALRQLLVDDGVPDSLIGAVVTRLLRKLQVKWYIAVIKDIKAAIRKGLLDEQKLQDRIANAGLPHSVFDNLKPLLKGMQAARPKEETAAQICKYFRQELITAKQAAQLLIANHYSPIAANRIVRSCIADAATPPKQKRQIADKLLKQLQGQG